MEKLLVKTGIYSFVLSFSFLFIFFPKQEPEMIMERALYFTEKPYYEYFISIFRYSLILSAVAVIIVGVVNLVNNGEMK